jgi:hypothetical protein
MKYENKGESARIGGKKKVTGKSKLMKKKKKR